MFRYILMFLSGGFAAFLANRSISVYNDAVRPLVPEYTEGRMKRIEFASTTFALSFGLVVGFGIPFSIMSPIILVHSLFLGTDIIGVVFPGKFIPKWYKDKESLWGAVLASLIGGIYGVLLLVGLQGFVNLMKLLPVNVFDAFSIVGEPVIFLFAVFPALAVAYEYGWLNGVISLVIIILTRIVAVRLGNTSPDGIALVVGLIILIIYAVTEKRDKNAQIDTASLFKDRAGRIKKNLIYIAVMGALYGIACNTRLLMEGPQSLLALKDNKVQEAINFTIARALSFIPLKGITALASGVFAIDGFGFVATAGLLSPNWIVAGIVGAIVMALEASSLLLVATLFDKFPGIKKAADNMRNAMTKLLEIALLVGAMMAGNKIAPSVGYYFVGGAYLLNEVAKKPIVRMAVGPIAVIALGIIINILAAIGLFQVG